MLNAKELRQRLADAAQRPGYNPNLIVRSAAAEYVEAMRSIVDKADSAGRSLLASEKRDFDKLEDELRRITLLGEEVREARERSLVTPAANIPPYAPDESADDPELRDAFVHYLRTGQAGPELRALSVGTDSAGGYAVPTGFRTKITERLKYYMPVRKVAEVISTDSGNDLPWPTNDDTSNTGNLLAENTQAVETDLVLGVKQLVAYKYTSDLVRASMELLQDADPALNLEGFLARKLGERIGRKQNTHFTTGTGTAQPQGIVTGATSGVTAASATVFTMDELIDLQHSVDVAYREPEPGAFVGWMMSDAAAKIARKLKASGTGDYLWQPPVQAGQPPMLLGFPVQINNAMSDPATGVKSVLFGNLTRGYVVRDVLNISVLVLNERYADYGQTGFIGFARADGLVQDAQAYRALTQA